MDSNITKPLNYYYMAIIVLLMVIFPSVSVWLDPEPAPVIDLIGKWFGFWGIGIRLFTAGLKQALKPSFTARQLFNLTDKNSLVIVRELGFANISLGALGIAALLIPSWRMAAAFTGGLYMGIAGIQHLVRMPRERNEWVALVSDLFITGVMATYLLVA